MANAAKCDICGRLYETPECRPEIEIVQDRHPYDPKRMDLCERCQKELNNFVKGNKFGKTRS